MNIYIANLNLAFSDQDLAQLFTPFGTVEAATIAIDGFTDQSRGFGYVDMPNEAEALTAMSALNQSEINGLVVTVKEAENIATRMGSYKVGNPTIKGYTFRKN